MLKRVLLFVAFAFMILVCGSSVAGEVGPLGRTTYDATVSSAAFTALSINTAKTTDWIKTDGWNEVTVWIDYTWSSATHVNMTCWEQRAGSTKAYKIPMCDDSVPPDSTCQLLRKRWPVTASDAWRWRIPIMGRQFQCSFITTGGGANDKASVVFIGGEQ